VYQLSAAVGRGYAGNRNHLTFKQRISLMPNTTNRVKLPYILGSQSQKEVTHNASLDLIDATPAAQR